MKKTAAPRLGTLKVTVMSKNECVQRARNLNQQAIGYRLSGTKRQLDWAADACKRRDEFMQQARTAQE
jgi:hypothetical protein